MRDFPSSHANLRKIVNTLLESDELIDKLWNIEHIAATVNNAANISGDSSRLVIDEIKRAYQVYNEHVEKVDGTMHMIIAKKTRDGAGSDGKGGRRVVYIGRFKEQPKEPKMKRNPPRNAAIMSVDMRKELNKFLKTRQEEHQKKKGKKNKKKEAPIKRKPTPASERRLRRRRRRRERQR